MVDLDPVFLITRLLLVPLCKRNHQDNLDHVLGNGRYPPSKQDLHENCHGKKLTNESQEFEVAVPSGHSGEPT